MRVVRIVLSLTLASALGVPLAAQRPAPITIERTAPASWRATYRFDAPVTRLRFERDAAFHRERVWRVVTPGFRIVRDGDTEAVVADSGTAATRTLVLEFPAYTAPLPKEYELFQPFSDGAVALYTGHFYAAPGVAGKEASFLRTLRIVPPAGMRGVVGGKTVAGVVTYTDAVGQGTYTYLGRATPIETPDVLAIVDPGMPAWLRSGYERDLPRLFAAYAAGFDAKLPWKPTVLFSFKDTTLSGYSSGGGTLPGLLNMTLTGQAWRTPSASGAASAFELLAHESAHLWNGQVVDAPDAPAMAWMHEGSADALAAAMVLRFGLIDSTEATRRQEATFNRCASAGTKGSVATALRRGAIKMVYDCGAMMAVWSVAAIRRAHPDATLLSFWKALVAAAQRQGGRYDEALYFATLRGQGVTDSTVATMQRFLTDSNGFAIAARGMRDVGVPIEASVTPRADVDQSDFVRSAFQHLMQQACAGRVSFSSGTPLKSSAIATCAPFATEHFVFRIEGHAVTDQGAALYDAVVARCAANAAVSLQDDAGAELVAVPCTKPLAARGPWWSIGALTRL